MVLYQDHYCRREIEEMTVLSNVDFSVQAVTCLVFVTVNEFVCVCVRVRVRKMGARRAATGLISKTYLIDFCLRHPFVFLLDESTDMHHMSHVAITRGEGVKGGVVYEYVIIPFSLHTCGTVGLWVLYYCTAL